MKNEVSFVKHVPKFLTDIKSKNISNLNGPSITAKKWTNKNHENDGSSNIIDLSTSTNIELSQVDAPQIVNLTEFIYSEPQEIELDGGMKVKIGGQKLDNNFLASTNFQSNKSNKKKIKCHQRIAECGASKLNEEPMENSGSKIVNLESGETKYQEDTTFEKSRHVFKPTKKRRYKSDSSLDKHDESNIQKIKELKQKSKNKPRVGALSFNPDE